METKKQQFRVKPLAAAVGLAMVVPFMIGTALAAAPANVPVNGTVVQGGATASATTVVGTFGAAGGSTTIAVSSVANVINWGNPNTAATLNPSSTLAGFNIGTGSAVDFTTTQAAAVVLNVDNSGQISTLDGILSGGANVNVFVANANGIVVGSGAVLTAPVLGLIASDVNSSALTQTTSAPKIALSFATAGSISVANGAKINAGNVGSVLIAGAGTVNIAGTSSGLISSRLVIDGGVSGLYDSSTSIFKATSSVGNVNLTTAATNVNLNLGTAGGVFTLNSVYADGNITNNGSVDLAASPEFTGTLTNNGIINQTGSHILTIGSAGASIVNMTGAITGATAAIYANSTIASNFGSVVNNGTIAAANGFNLGIAGTFTNNTGGQLNVTGAATMTDSGFNNAGLVSVASLASGNFGDFSNANGSFTNTGTIKVNGNFAVNDVATPLGDFSNSGTITVATNQYGDTINAGGTVSNTGTMTFGNGSISSLYLDIRDANFSNTGTLSLLTSTTGNSNLYVNSSVSGTLAGSFSAPTLNGFGFTAGTAAGNIAQINTNAINASGTVALKGFNVMVDSSVAAGGIASVTVGGLPNTVLGTLSVATGATLAGTSNLYINAHSNGFANVSANGTLLGKTVDLGNSGSLNNINIGGGITANNVDIYATGVVNKAMGGGTAALNYLDNAAVITPLTGGTTGTTSLYVDATGTHVQTWNVKVDGNLSASSGTNNFETAGLNNGGNNGAANVGSLGYFAPAANAYSQLRLQATGNLVLAGGSSGHDISGYGAFTWPGQIVAIAAGNLVTTASVDNAFTNSGAYNGIFLQGNALSITAPIYTNGGAWINFKQTGYGQAGITGNPATMTSYYQLSEPTNTSTGVASYASGPINPSSLKTGRQFVSGYVPK